TLTQHPEVPRNPPGPYVYVIKDQTASLRTITPGTTDGTQTAVQGLEPQEVVAVNGFDKLLDGAKVTVRAPSSSGGGGAAGQQGQAGQTNQAAPQGTPQGGAPGGKNGASP